jgi:hypothetical protein
MAMNSRLLRPLVNVVASVSAWVIESGNTWHWSE